jgi:hypothetical protein
MYDHFCSSAVLYLNDPIVFLPRNAFRRVFFPLGGAYWNNEWEHLLGFLPLCMLKCLVYGPVQIQLCVLHSEKW